MAYFMLSIGSFVIVFTLYLVKTKKWGHSGYFLLFLLILTGTLVYSLKVRPWSSRGIESYYKEMILFVSMILGMATNTISKRIRGKKFNVQITDLVKSLFIAPIVFFAIWGAIEKMVEFNFITCCFAYTNGYFWETILQQVKAEIGQQNTRKS